MTYIAEEPEALTGFKDRSGTVHADRDTALMANVAIDVAKEAINAACRHKMPENVPHWYGRELVRFCQENPEMIAALIGYRDAT